MPMLARSVSDVVLGESTYRGDLSTRIADAKNIYSAIVNRSVATGVSPQSVVSNRSQFNAYGKPLPPGAEQYREAVEQAIADVDENGVTHQGLYFATPAAAKNLPRGLVKETSVKGGHVIYSDPKGRPIKTGIGVKAVDLDKLSAIPFQAPIPEARPMDPVTEAQVVEAINAVAAKQMAIDTTTAPISQADFIGDVTAQALGPVTSMPGADAVISDMAMPSADIAKGPRIGALPTVDVDKGPRIGEMPTVDVDKGPRAAQDAIQAALAGFDPARFSAAAPAEEAGFPNAAAVQAAPTQSVQTQSFTQGPEMADVDVAKGPRMSADPMMEATQGPYTANGLTNTSASLSVPAVAVETSTVPGSTQSYADPVGGLSMMEQTTSDIAPGIDVSGVPTNMVQTTSVDPTAQLAAALSGNIDPNPGYDMAARAQTKAFQDAAAAAAAQNATIDGVTPRNDQALTRDQMTTTTNLDTSGMPAAPDVSAAPIAGPSDLEKAMSAYTSLPSQADIAGQTAYGNAPLAGASLIGATQRIGNVSYNPDGTVATQATEAISTNPADASAALAGFSALPDVGPMPEARPTVDLSSEPTYTYDPATDKVVNNTVTAPAADEAVSDTSAPDVSVADPAVQTRSTVEATTGTTSTPTTSERVGNAMFSGRTAGTLVGGLGGGLAFGPVGAILGALLGSKIGSSYLGDQQKDEGVLGALLGGLTGTPANQTQSRGILSGFTSTPFSIKMQPGSMEMSGSIWGGTAEPGTSMIASDGQQITALGNGAVAVTNQHGVTTVMDADGKNTAGYFGNAFGGENGGGTGGGGGSHSL